MKKLITIFFLTAITIGLNAQIFYADTLETIAYWEQGENYHYQLDKYKYTEKSDGVTELNSTSYITLHIQEETDTNYLIRYTIDSVKVDGTMNSSTLAGLSPEVSNKLSYIIETDEYGSLIEIKNWEELRENIRLLYTELNLFSDMKKREQKQAMQAIETMTDSREKIQSMFSKEFSTLFTNYGYVFDTTDTLEYDQVLPNPYGGTPFPKLGTISFDASNVEETNSVTIHDYSSIDEEEAKKAIMEVLTEIAPNRKGMKEGMKDIEFKIEDSITQEFDIYSGAILNASMERHISSYDLSEKNVRIDRQIWKLLSVD